MFKKKKSIISKSTIEVKLITLATTNDEVNWLHDHMYEISM
jgi:hypothetical protein